MSKVITSKALLDHVENCIIDGKLNILSILKLKIGLSTMRIHDHVASVSNFEWEAGARLWRALLESAKN